MTVAARPRRNYHVERCFAEGLQAHAVNLLRLSVQLAPTMPPMVAYKAGQTFAEKRAAIARRKGKKK